MFRHVLFVGTERGEFERSAAALRACSFGGQHLNPGADLESALDEEHVDVVVLASNLPEHDVRGLCENITKNHPSMRVIVEGPEVPFDELLRFMRAGASDYLTAPVTSSALVESLCRVVDADRAHTASRASAPPIFEGLIGASEPMLALFDTIERAAKTSATVLLTGPSGTGKELIARALHRRSTRRDGPFIAVNCSALPAELLESELFGHTKGAFTGANIARRGLFVAGATGTVFLDEIGDMPLSLQPKLLRALQEHSVRPVGSDHEIPTDVRLIAATNRNLRAAIADHTFREDLFYRIDVIHIDVPPLSERDDDVILLARYYAELYAEKMGKSVSSVSPDAVQRLLAYNWPGNVRELQNCIERAVALTDHAEIGVADLPTEIRTCKAAVPTRRASQTTLTSLAEMERRYILRVLGAVHGNRKEAAKILAVDRKTLYRRLRRYGFARSRRSSDFEGTG